MVCRILGSSWSTVLRLVAEGLDTKEIARKLCYCERTVKNVFHDVTTSSTFETAPLPWPTPSAEA